jgi:hypothetical protein
MRAPANPRSISPLTTALAEVVDQWKEISAIPSEVDAFGRAMTTMAADLALSPAELRALAAKDANARQLASLLQALRIDILALAEQAPTALRDMRRACTVCGQKARCNRDIAARTQLARHQTYCANATLLRKLRQDRELASTTEIATLQRESKPER